MSFPEITRLELPILQELKATGGSDQPRYLYDRLVRYFPQMTPTDAAERNAAGRSLWHARVQRAGKQLETLGEIRRQQNLWTVTPRGLRRVEAEALQPEPATKRTPKSGKTLSHKDAQQMLVEIGQVLGRYAETEFDHYDVVWRDSASAPRLSHVFEVQISGSVDSALTRLKQAYETQRSKIFLVVADERDKRFAGRRLSGSFHEIWEAVTVIGAGELQQLHDALLARKTLLAALLARR